MKYGYARVSTDGQSVDAQVRQLTKAGCNTLATIAGRKADFRSPGDTWADTTTPHGRLTLAVLGGLAESNAS